MWVRVFDVRGNTLLPEVAVQARLASLTGQRGIDELRAAVGLLQDMYRQAGYGGIAVFLPEQDLQDGVVQIRVVEGLLTRVEVSDNRQFTAANIRRSLPSLAEGRTPLVSRIDAEILVANENPAKTVQVLLQPGNDPGTIAARVTVAELPVQRWTARLENTGSSSTGRWRAALGWQNANVADADHVASAELQTAPERPSGVAVVSASYRVPLYGRAMSLDGYAAYSDVTAGKSSTPVGDLAFSGKGTILGLRATMYLPRYANIDQRVLIGAEWREYLNNCAIDGLPDGACGSAGASVSVLPLSLTYLAQTSGDWNGNFSASWHHNLGMVGAHRSQSDFTAVRPGSQRSYDMLRFAGQLSLPVADVGAFTARGSAQQSLNVLVPGEQFGVGGAQGVRGYNERELAGDNGLQLTLEYNSPRLGSWQPGGKPLELALVSFADAGWVSNRQGDPCQPGRASCRLGGLGAGVRATWQQAQGRLDVARAMATGSATVKGDWRGHLSIVFTF